MSKQYKVGFWYTEYGQMVVEADSKEDAEKWVFDELEQNGVDETEYKCNDREYGTTEAEELA